MKALRNGLAGALLMAFCCWVEAGPAPGKLPLAEGLLVKVQQKAEAVSAPQVLMLSNAVVTLFSTNNSVSAGRVLYRGLQNTGTNAFLYAINTTNVSGTNYHGIVAGGLAVHDGLGSIVDLSKVPWPVSVTAESGATEVSVIELVQ